MEIGKNELKKILQEQRKEYQRHIEVLIEDFDKKVDILSEGHKVLAGKLETNDKILIRIDERLERIEDNIEIIKIGLKRKVDQEEFVALVKRVAILENKLKKV